ncbi:death-associated inhibitor of apoptosis 1-like isoform X2 [Ischnura elegans]|uniref:death-associated inhibitor of apoptosis 1-like isoform X2 n=1 Tax=Ischnura elegans TaxID=197161 RepID=UPI001ED8BB6E|nr:death-associated inhibitor of apoptosis 1-like isoform X2 [Ischnura elegans]
MPPNEGSEKVWTSVDSGAVSDLSNRFQKINQLMITGSMPTNGSRPRTLPSPSQDERDNGNSGTQGFGDGRENGDSDQDHFSGASRRGGDRKNSSSSSVPRVSVSEDLLKREDQRIKTFQNWPLDYLRPEVLAAAGFYHVRDDLVRCAFCKIEIVRWEKGDIPMKEHKRWSSHCPFVRGIPCGNIPIDESGASHETDNGEMMANENLSYDTCGIHEEMLPFSFCDDEHPRATSAQRAALPIMKATHAGEASDEDKEQATEPPLEKLGVRDLRAAVHPEYCSEASRLSSYSSWPVAIKQRPNALAEAGFYYTGNGDQTICFHCGGGLRDWEDGDDPWIEHAKWFSKCYFVNLVKGSEFVSKVADTRPAVMNAEEAKDLTETCPNAARQEAVSSLAAKPTESEKSACGAPSTSQEPTVECESESTKGSKVYSLEESGMCKINWWSWLRVT